MIVRFIQGSFICKCSFITDVSQDSSHSRPEYECGVRLMMRE